MRTIALLASLAAAQPGDPHVIDSWRVETTKPISGADFLLIQEAYKHPEINGRDMSCYHIVIVREKGVRTVAFLGNREPDRQVQRHGQIAIIIAGPNPRCPSRSFVMDDGGRVVRVVYERH
jgi:hypothetical protein